MSVQPPPTVNSTIFNPAFFQSASSTSLTTDTADKRYLKLSGGILTGLLTTSAGISTPTLFNVGTLTLPTTTDTLIGRNTTDTLTNKTLTGAVITGGTLTVGASTVSMVATTGQLINQNSNQNVGGIKTFTTAPICTAAGVGTFAYLNLAQTLTNKTLTASKFGANGTNFDLTQFGKTSISGTSGTITFSNAFASPPTVCATLEQTDTGYLFLLQITSTSTTGFTWNQYLITISVGATCTVAGDAGFIHWIATA